MEISKIKIDKNSEETIFDVVDETIFKNQEHTISDFSIIDEQGNILVAFEDGGIRTKNFNSSEATTEISIVNKEECDLAVSDSSNNNILILKDGNIRTKNFISNQFMTELSFEGGNIDSMGIESYDMGSFENYSRTSYFVDVKNATGIKANRSYQIFMFDSNHTYLGELNYISNKIYPLKSYTKYIRLSINIPEIEKDSIILYGSNECPVETKKVAQRVESGEGLDAINRSEKITYKCDSQIYTTARLMLPPNYSIDGKKVPLILWDSGDGDFTSWNYEMGNAALRLKGLQFCRDMGFAVLQVYSWGSDNYKKYSNNNRAAMPIPTHLLIHAKGVEYVCDRYNVDPENVFQISKSGSGKLSLYYALHQPSFNLRKIYALAPVFDDFVFLGAGSLGYRRAMNADMRFENVGEQLDYFINGTPVSKGGNGTSWYFGKFESPEKICKETELDKINNVAEAQDFIVQNGHKFTCMGVAWENLIGRDYRKKIIETTKFSYIYWYNIVELISEPSDWATNYNDYLIFDENTGMFLQIDRQVAPTFESNKFYKTQSFTPGDSTLKDRCFNRYDLNIVANGVPITVIMGQKDRQTPYWSCLEVITQIRNAGGKADIVTISNGDHSDPDAGTVGSVSNVQTLYGGTYEVVSIGWFLSIYDIIRRYIKSESVGFPIITISNNIVTIVSKTPDASIYYTTDGSTPNTESTLYTSQITVSQGDNYTLKAVAYKNGMLYSDILQKEIVYTE